MSFSLHLNSITSTRYSKLLAFYTEVFGGELVRKVPWDLGQHELDARNGLQDSAGRVTLLRFSSEFFGVFCVSHPERPPSEPPILLTPD